MCLITPMGYKPAGSYCCLLTGDTFNLNINGITFPKFIFTVNYGFSLQCLFFKLVQ